MKYQKMKSILHILIKSNGLDREIIGDSSNGTAILEEFLKLCLLFFNRGFGAKKREDVEPYAAIHGPLLTISHPAEDTPKAPPRRKRPQRLINAAEDEQVPSLPLRRSLSFTDAHYIAQAMCEGDTKLIEELYPDFPRSEPIYAGKYLHT